MSWGKKYRKRIPRTHNDNTDAAYTGEDAELQLGYDVDSYTILNTGQYSGTTSLSAGIYTWNHSNECVIHHPTGLMFSTNTQDGPGDPSDVDINVSQIFDMRDSANTNSLAGHTDWRIPNSKEVITIHNESVQGFIDTGVFDLHTDKNNICTSSFQGTNVYYVVNVSGVLALQAKTITWLGCLLVRGPDTPSNNWG